MRTNPRQCARLIPCDAMRASLQRPQHLPDNCQCQDHEHGVSGPAANVVHEITGQSLDIQTRRPPHHALSSTGQRLPYWQKP